MGRGEWVTPQKTAPSLALNLFNRRQLCRVGMSCTENGSRSLRTFSPPRPRKGKGKVVPTALRKSLRRPPVQGADASSFMDRLPPCGRRGECGSAGNGGEGNASGLNQSSSYLAGSARSVPCRKAVMRLRRVELALGT